MPSESAVPQELLDADHALTDARRHAGSDPRRSAQYAIHAAEMATTASLAATDPAVTERAHHVVADARALQQAAEESLAPGPAAGAAGDALEVIAAEARRRGLGAHGGLHADIWHRALAWAKYGPDGQPRAQRLSNEQAILTLPEHVWQEAAAAFPSAEDPQRVSVAALLTTTRPPSTARSATQAGAPLTDRPAAPTAVVHAQPGADLGL